MGHLRKMDIVVVSGFSEEAGLIRMATLTRPQYIQMKKPKMIGAPIPWTITDNISQRRKKKQEVTQPD